MHVGFHDVMVGIHVSDVNVVKLTGDPQPIVLGVQGTVAVSLKSSWVTSNQLNPTYASRAGCSDRPSKPILPGSTPGRGTVRRRYAAEQS